MIRHTKKSVQTLTPTPIRHTVIVDPTPKEYAIYNGVAAAARTNLVVTNIDAKTPGKLHPDSLLNPMNRKYASQLLHNLRAATYGGYKMIVHLSDESFVETINLLNKLKVDPDLQAEAIRFIRRAGSIDSLTECKVCARHLQLLMLLPCGHIVCCDCVEARYHKAGTFCPLCNTHYDWEDMQKIQPGFDYKSVEDEWTYDETPDPAQNTVSQGSNKGKRRRRRRKSGDAVAVQQQDGKRPRYRPIDLSKYSLVIASKALYVVSRIKYLRKEFATAQSGDLSQENCRGMTSERPKALKAIVYSQFREHIARIKVAFAQQGIKCADFFPGVKTAYRMANLLRFRHEPSCDVLLLTDLGSHGLDLSFVTHIFLVEEIWDKSLEEQVVSRAHRMGACHSVVTEKLLMRGSVEIVMNEMNKKSLMGNDTDVDSHQDEMEDCHVMTRSTPEPTANRRAIGAFIT